MKNFLIVTNKDKDPGLVFSEKIVAYIQEKGGTGRIAERNSTDSALIDADAYGKIDVILVLGGDGTMIRAARDLRRCDIPLIGLNMGHLGYLCELDETSVFPALDAVFENNYEIEERMLLCGEVLGQDRRIEPHNALNDIVIHRSGLTQIVSLHVQLNGKDLTDYNCDGLLLATPTGSTAYNMSAGGPIIDPKAQMMVITPLNPQALSKRSIVIGSDADVVIEVMHRNTSINPPCLSVSFDGDTACELKPGDRIHIRKAEETVRILKISQTSFVETLSRKLNNYQ